MLALIALSAIGYSSGRSIAAYYGCDGYGYGYGYCPPPPPPPPRVPAHFLHYQLSQPEEALEDVTVVDQFGTLRVQLEEPEWLLNPTEKRRTGRPPEPIQRPDEHLVCYGLNKTIPARSVRVSNQFRTTTLRVADGLALCVPASKSETGAAGPPPTDLDHYLCYDVLSETPLLPSETLVVRDQFGERTIRIDRARELCNPVEKRRDGRAPVPIKRPEEHLVCYRITIVSPNITSRDVFTNDQFGPRKLRVDKFFGSVSSLRRLCVPSTKTLL